MPPYSSGAGGGVDWRKVKELGCLDMKIFRRSVRYRYLLENKYLSPAPPGDRKYSEQEEGNVKSERRKKGIGKGKM
jgi:hypothetical protein